MTKSGYFILATKVTLRMGITYFKILFCHGISEGSEGKKLSTIYYNYGTVYDWFNNPFTAGNGINIQI